MKYEYERLRRKHEQHKNKLDSNHDAPVHTTSCYTGLQNQCFTMFRQSSTIFTASLKCLFQACYDRRANLPQTALVDPDFCRPTFVEKDDYHPFPQNSSVNDGDGGFKENAVLQDKSTLDDPSVSKSRKTTEKRCWSPYEIRVSGSDEPRTATPDLTRRKSSKKFSYEKLKTDNDEGEDSSIVAPRNLLLDNDECEETQDSLKRAILKEQSEHSRPSGGHHYSCDDNKDWSDNSAPLVTRSGRCGDKMLPFLWREHGRKLLGRVIVVVLGLGADADEGSRNINLFCQFDGPETERVLQGF